MVSLQFFCRYLEANPGIVRSLDVLEIGSGCGLCGLLSAKLAAKQVSTLACNSMESGLNMQISLSASPINVHSPYQFAVQCQ